MNCIGRNRKGKRMPAKKLVSKMIALKALLPKVEMLKHEIATKRDELRNIVSDIQEIVDSVDSAVDSLDEGCRSFTNAVESMSQYL